MVWTRITCPEKPGPSVDHGLDRGAPSTSVTALAQGSKARVVDTSGSTVALRGQL